MNKRILCAKDPNVRTGFTLDKPPSLGKKMFPGSAMHHRMVLLNRKHAEENNHRADTQLVIFPRLLSDQPEEGITNACASFVLLWARCPPAVRGSLPHHTHPGWPITPGTPTLQHPDAGALTPRRLAPSRTVYPRGARVNRGLVETTLQSDGRARFRSSSSMRSTCRRSRGAKPTRRMHSGL